MIKKFKYSGLELDLFEHAVNRNSYYYELCFKLFKVNKKVLEVGAGIGGISKFFIPKTEFSSWTLIEPDSSNFIKLIKNINFKKKYNINALNIDINQSLKTLNNFDIILLVDVLEHIKRDKEILGKLFNNLNANGKIIIFVPACQFLYSEFDKQIGHYRRYNISKLKKILPKNSNIIDLKYIDSVGFFASLFNKILLKSSNPTRAQILFWDRILIPMSKIIDKFLAYKFGKNIYLSISK